MNRIYNKGLKKIKTYKINLLDKHIYLAGILLFIAIITNIVFQFFKPFILSLSYNKIMHLPEIMLLISIGFFTNEAVELIKSWILHSYEKRKSIDYSLPTAKTKYKLLQQIVSAGITLCMIVAILITFMLITPLK